MNEDLLKLIDKLDIERGALRILVREALHLRQHGERAPGGNETWADWDQRAESCLRQIDG